MSIFKNVFISAALMAAMFLDAQLAAAQKLDWQRAPRMTLERQFAGPLTDTIIQRLRDPVDGSICYVYLPISASHSERGNGDYVQYGPNVIGTISCTIANPQPSITGSIPKKK